MATPDTATHIDEHDLFRQIWPDGIPDSERLVFDTVPVEQRQPILRRLKAVWLAQEKKQTWVEAAKLAELSRSGFYKLKAAWRKNGIAGVIPHETQRPRSQNKVDDDPWMDRAKTLLRLKANKPNLEIAKTIVDEMELGDDIDYNKRLSILQKVERTLVHERRASFHDPGYLKRAYGKGLIIDLSAVAIQIPDGSDGSGYRCLCDGEWFEPHPWRGNRLPSGRREIAADRAAGGNRFHF